MHDPLNVKLFSIFVMESQMRMFHAEFSVYYLLFTSFCFSLKNTVKCCLYSNVKGGGPWNLHLLALQSEIFYLPLSEDEKREFCLRYLITWILFGISYHVNFIWDILSREYYLRYLLTWILFEIYYHVNFFRYLNTWILFEISYQANFIWDILLREYYLRDIITWILFEISYHVNFIFKVPCIVTLC
jgi:hypothetical protein